MGRPAGGNEEGHARERDIGGRGGGEPAQGVINPPAPVADRPQVEPRPPVAADRAGELAQRLAAAREEEEEGGGPVAAGGAAAREREPSRPPLGPEAATRWARLSPLELAQAAIYALVAPEA